VLRPDEWGSIEPEGYSAWLSAVNGYCSVRGPTASELCGNVELNWGRMARANDAGPAPATEDSLS